MILHYLLAKIRKIKTKNKEKRRKNKHRAVNYAKFDAFLSVIRSNLDIFVLSVIRSNLDIFVSIFIDKLSKQSQEANDKSI